MGRWRGETVDEENDNRRVFLLWDGDGALCFSRSYAALEREIDRLKPWEVGDSVAIYRGVDYVGEKGTGYSFGVEKEPSTDPLPDGDGDPLLVNRRSDDARPDELLAEAGRTAARLGLAVGWTDGVVGGQVKEVSGTGKAAWKRAVVLSDAEYAAGFYVKRCRARNPVTVAGARICSWSRSTSTFPTTRIPPMRRSRPGSQRCSSAWGSCCRRRSPCAAGAVCTSTSVSRTGARPVKVQIDEQTGIAPARDGYVVGVPGLHELPGVVYRYLRDDALATCPRATHTRLVERGEETREKAWADFKAGEPIAKGWRNETIFHAALELVREGKPRGQILERLLEVNREQCDPPLAEERVRKQLDGAVTYARRNPTADEELREKARRRSPRPREREREDAARAGRGGGLGGAGADRDARCHARARRRAPAELARRVGATDLGGEGRRARSRRELSRSAPSRAGSPATCRCRRDPAGSSP